MGIADRFPSVSKRMLRERIYTNYAPTPVCEGMVRISAKRMTELSASAYSEKKAEYLNSHQRITPPLSHSFFLDSLPPVGQVVSESDVPRFLDLIRRAGTGKKQIGALILGPQQELMGYAWNTGETNPVLHAELNLSRALLQGNFHPLPEGSTLWSTLEPCAMCAAQILNLFSPGSRFQVHYLNPDPGPATRNSCLKAESALWIRAGKPRVRYQEEV